MLYMYMSSVQSVTGFELHLRQLTAATHHVVLLYNISKFV